MTRPTRSRSEPSRSEDDRPPGRRAVDSPADARRSSVVVLPAGSGTRMRSKTMKVLHPVCGRSMVGHVLTAALHVEPEHLVAVVGHGREQVGPHILDAGPRALLAVQETQEGTGPRRTRRARGPAPRQRVRRTGSSWSWRGTPRCWRARPSPPWSPTTVRTSARALTMLTAEVADPFGYGRVLRDDDGDVTGDRRGEGRDSRAGRGPRDQQRHLRLRRALPRRRPRRGSATTTPRGSTTSPTWWGSPAATAARSARTASTT